MERLVAAKRLVTITGTGGCGQRRWALRVAADVGEPSYIADRRTLHRVPSLGCRESMCSSSSAHLAARGARDPAPIGLTGEDSLFLIELGGRAAAKGPRSRTRRVANMRVATQIRSAKERPRPGTSRWERSRAPISSSALCAPHRQDPCVGPWRDDEDRFKRNPEAPGQPGELGCRAAEPAGSLVDDSSGSNRAGRKPPVLCDVEKDLAPWTSAGGVHLRGEPEDLIHSFDRLCRFTSMPPGRTRSGRRGSEAVSQAF